MKITFLIIALFLAPHINAQLIRSGNLTTFVDSLISEIPDSTTLNKNKYVSPTAQDRTSFANVLTNILAGQYATAHTDAGVFGYQLIQYTDTSSTPNKIFYLLLKTAASANYWGSYLFNQNCDRQRLIIQSPHPVYDTYTGAQGFYIFKNVGARAFFLTGAHRCNSNTESNCDGTTTVCTGSTTGFMISDQAHSDESFFQRGTETLAGLISNLVVIQIHGFSKQVSDPDVILSNGTKITPSGTDYTDNLRANLLIEDNTLTFKIPNIDTTWERLNGTTNTQGRFINGSGDPCANAASSSTGRFIHIEQKKDGMRNPSSNWSKLSNAIANSIPLDALPVEVNSFTISTTPTSIILSWETATEVNNYGFEIQRASASPSKIWEKISFVQGYGNSNSPKYYSFIDTTIASGSYQYRLKQIDADGHFEYSFINEIYFNKVTDFTLSQNYPNPFNPTTTIQYQIKGRGHVNLKVFDLLGREVALLVNEMKEPGVYDIKFDGSKLGSGIYIYRINTNSFSASRKFVLLK